MSSNKILLFWQTTENERKQKERQIHGSYQTAEKTVDHEGDGYTNSS